MDALGLWHSWGTLSLWTLTFIMSDEQVCSLTGRRWSRLFTANATLGNDPAKEQSGPVTSSYPTRWFRKTWPMVDWFSHVLLKVTRFFLLIKIHFIIYFLILRKDEQGNIDQYGWTSVLTLEILEFWSYLGQPREKHRHLQQFWKIRLLLECVLLEGIKLLASF